MPVKVMTLLVRYGRDNAPQKRHILGPTITNLYVHEGDTMTLFLL